MLAAAETPRSRITMAMTSTSTLRRSRSRVISRNSWPLRASSSETSTAAFGHSAGTADEQLGFHPFQPRSLRVTRKLLFHEVAAFAVVGGDERRFGDGP